MSSFTDSVFNTFSNARAAVSATSERRKTDNQALVKNAKIIDIIAKVILALSAIKFMSVITFPVLMSTLPILFGCALVAYASYEVSIVSNNIKNYVTESYLVWWKPEKSFAENLGLDQLASGARAQVISDVTKNTPFANWLLNFLYR